MAHLSLCLHKQDMSKFENVRSILSSLTSNRQVKESYILLK